MRFKILFILQFITISFLFAQTKPTVTFSQTRGCVNFTDTIRIKNNGYCTPTAPNFILASNNPSIRLTSNDSLPEFQILVSTPGMINLTITCSAQGGFLPPLVGVFTIAGLTTNQLNFNLSGCSSNSYKLDFLNKNYDNYLVNWADGNTSLLGISETSLQHQYSNDATRNITVTGVYEYTVSGQGLVNSCRKDSIANADLYPSLTAPGFTQLSVENLSPVDGRALLNISVSGKLKYRQYQREVGFPFTSQDSLIGFSDGFHIYSVSGLNSSNKIYCFKFDAFDECGNSLEATNPEICTLSISGIAKTDGNHINVGQYNQVALIVLTLTSSSISQVDNKILDALDSDVICGNTYVYRASASDSPLNTKISISAPLALISIKTIPGLVSPPNNFIATYGAVDEKMTLNWDPLTTTSVSLVIRNDQNRLIATVSGIGTGTSLNPSYQPPSPYSKCYFIKINSNCGQSDSVKACPPDLDAFASSLETNTISWENAVANSTTIGVPYTLQFYAQGKGNIPYFVLNNATSSYTHTLSSIDPVDTTSQVLYYRVITTYSGKEIRSAFKRVKQDLRFWAPTAFTPNGDGLNDTFTPKGLFWDKYELTIYNRWGQAIFVTTDKLKCWDGGQFNPDIYHFVSKVEDQYGGVLEKQGTFQLIR